MRTHLVPLIRFNSSLYWNWQPEANIDTGILRRYRALESVVLTETAPRDYPLTLPIQNDEKWHIRLSLIRENDMYTW